ncbi:MAG: sigma-54 dependent transcriptional regulator [Sedimentisphaerales bacterium]|nr:sigma-54 dependent transcriptional regulator [Sedimentisphaerales bacterium]
MINKQNITQNVLIIGNDAVTTRCMLEIFAKKALGATVAVNERAAIEYLDTHDYDLIFIHCPTDKPACVHQIFDLLAGIKKRLPELPILMTIDADTINAEKIATLAVRAIRSGCADCLTKPLSRETVERLIETFLPGRSVPTLASEQQNARCLYQIIGKNAKFTQAISLAQRVAPTTAPALITGESGTGKELLSYLVYRSSRRSDGPYIRVNCAALNDSLLESELFGHEKGAFTGAHAQRKGRFEQADGGTLLLDEITETGARFQAQLLRVLEQQDFERVGGNESIRINVRIISTTNRNLLDEVHQGRFRADLYYRLSGVRLFIPPLRERRDDLPSLIWHFVNLYAHEACRRITDLDPAMLDVFAKYHWPGNVRQLRNVVRTSLILGTGTTLSLADVSWLIDELQPLCQSGESAAVATPADDSAETLESIERQAILKTLRHTDGNQTRAAKVLGISDRTLREKIRRYRQTLATVG